PLSFFLYSPRPHPFLHSFPTRRSSDLIKHYYGLSNSMAGLLQTSFVVSYMIMAPIFGFLGDRYSRKWLMAVGILFWSITTLIGRSEEHTSELQSQSNLVCRLLLEKKKN